MKSQRRKRLDRRPSRRSSHRILATGLRAEIKRLAKASEQRRAAVAYVTSEDEIAFREGDVLVIDASDAMIAGGQTSAAVLKRAFRRGAELYNLSGLHAKLLLFDDTAVIGSANLSRSGLIEAGLVSKSHVIVAGVASLIDEFTRRGISIDEGFLRRVSKIPVHRTRPVSRVRGPKPRIRERGNRTWLVAVKELRDDAFPAEAGTAARGMRAAERRARHPGGYVSWIRFGGNSRFRREARKGDSVIQIYTELGASRPRVWAPSVILHVQRNEVYSRFYNETLARDDETTLSWTDFTRLARRCGLPPPPKEAVREIPADIAERLAEQWGKV